MGAIDRVIQQFTLMYWTFETALHKVLRKTNITASFFQYCCKNFWHVLFKDINLNKEKSYIGCLLFHLIPVGKCALKTKSWYLVLLHCIDKTRDSQYWLEPLLMDMPIPNILSDKLPSKICHLWVNINKIIYLSANQTKPSPQNNTPHGQCM